MSRPRSLVVLALLLGGLCCSAIFGCSLVKLSDEVGREQCSGQKDCDELNTGPDFDPCLFWQCSEKSFCELLPLDDDKDGHAPPECAASLEGVGNDAGLDTPADDCNDNADAINPDQDEECDGLDNNCDGLTDEGKLSAETEEVLTVSGDENGPESVTALSYAVSPSTREIAVAYSMEVGANAVPGASLVRFDLTTRGTPQKLTVPATSSDIGIAALGDADASFAVGFYDNQSTDKRLVAGITNATELRKTGPERVLTIAESVLANGLSCAPNEDCSCAPDEDCDIRTPPTFVLALAGNDDVLLAYLRKSPDEDSVAPTVSACQLNVHEEQGAGPYQLAANLLRRAGGTFAERGEEPAAIVLGHSFDQSPAAVSTLSDRLCGEDFSGCWLVSWSNEKGDIVATVVRGTEDGPAVAVAPPAILVASEGQFQAEVSMALGPSADDRRIIGVAFKRGCLADARVVARFFELAQDPEGKIELNELSDVVHVDDDGAERLPSIAYSEDKKSWIVVYKKATPTLKAKVLVLGEDGETRGADPYVIFEQERGGSAALLRAPVAYALPRSPDGDTSGWFGAVTYTQQEDGEGNTSYSFLGIRLGCPVAANE